MQHLRNVSTLKIHGDRCTGCGFCENVCPHAVIVMNDGKAAVKTLDSCMECGACQKNCPFGAISVKAGVGCADAIIKGMISGKEPTCGCSCGKENSGCC